jgi:hypothetical protein
MLLTRPRKPQARHTGLFYFAEAVSADACIRFPLSLPFGRQFDGENFARPPGLCKKILTIHGDVSNMVPV